MQPPGLCMCTVVRTWRTRRVLLARAFGTCTWRGPRVAHGTGPVDCDSHSRERESWTPPDASSSCAQSVYPVTVVPISSLLDVERGGQAGLSTVAERNSASERSPACGIDRGTDRGD